jgi:hypothetical protein
MTEDEKKKAHLDLVLSIRAEAEFKPVDGWGIWSVMIPGICPVLAHVSFDDVIYKDIPETNIPRDHVVTVEGAKVTLLYVRIGSGKATVFRDADDPLIVALCDAATEHVEEWLIETEGGER